MSRAIGPQVARWEYPGGEHVAGFSLPPRACESRLQATIAGARLPRFLSERLIRAGCAQAGRPRLRSNAAPSLSPRDREVDSLRPHRNAIPSTPSAAFSLDCWFRKCSHGSDCQPRQPCSTSAPCRGPSRSRPHRSLSWSSMGGSKCWWTLAGMSLSMPRSSESWRSASRPRFSLLSAVHAET